MKKGILLPLLTLALALSLSADERERHQSFISYDEGGTVVRTAEDNKEVEAHRNLPVYPGDEIVTARRGRAEVHLSDGNIIGIDRATVVRFRSILDSYEGADDETVVELRSGKIAVHRTDIGRDVVRLDTDNASYVATREAVYSVETDTRGRDRVLVFDGSVEVRTPSRTSRLRTGEAASVDDRGPYDLIGDQRLAADEFERWFLKRAERFGTYTSKYMDRRLSYWNDDLDDHGRWVFVTGIGWSWRPYVAVGWRPYYNGYWANRRGCLTWVSYDPWAWGTYHYGRWAYDPFNGWIWVPGYGYSPAWVYWMYGSNYVGWAPSGWWDCHRGYYDWAYRPYRHSSVGFGFYGRIRVHDMDLRPWTFIDSNTLITNRIDRAALTTDAIKSRLGRNREDTATISAGPTRFTREEVRDPAAAIRRRSIGNDSGREAGTPADLTPYFRRDPQLPTATRDRILRARGGSPGAGSSTPSSPTAGSVAPIGRGNVAPIGREPVAPIGRGAVAPIDRSNPAPAAGATTPSSGSPGRINRGGDNGSAAPSWRDRTRSGNPNEGGATERPAVERPSPSTPESGSTARPAGDWRRRNRTDEPAPAPAPGSGATSGAANDDNSSRGSTDVPRRVIDRIGGARVYPRDTEGGSEPPAARDSAPPPARDSSASRDSGSSTRERSVRRERDSGSSSRDSGSTSRDSGSRSSGGSSAGSSGSSKPSGGSNNNSGGNRDSGGGRIKRDQ